MIRKINIGSFDEFREAVKEEIIFIKPFPARLIRLYQIPAKHAGNKELIEVLNTLCTRHHKGVYYFRVLDKQDELLLPETLACMGIESFFVRSDVPDILN